MGGWEGAVRSEGSIAPAPGSLPSVGYNLTALSQDTCRAKTRHPTKTGACGDILVRAKPPMSLEWSQEPQQREDMKTHTHAHIQQT